MSRRRLPPLVFRVGHAPSLDAAPERFVPATVPGAVQLDWAKAEGWPPHTLGDEWKRYGWMEDVFWRYEAALDGVTAAAGERVFLVLRGVDYRYQVRVDDELIHEQEGMFASAELDLSRFVGRARTLTIVVWPVPKYDKAHRPKAQASRSCKPAVSYGWDFHPRLVPLGIWDEVYLESRPAAHLADVAVTSRLAPNRAHAEITAAVTVAGGGGAVRLTVRDPGGGELTRIERAVEAGVVTLRSTIAKPALWWPRGEGEQALHRVTVELIDERGAVVDVVERRHGFRRVRLVMHEGAWDEPSTFPKGRSHPPITLEVNGRVIFGRGSNWVCPDIFPGRLDRARYAELLALAEGAHFNMLRVWGGAIVNKESFFEECDERGLLVWQEFPLACNDYADDPAYLAVLEREARAIVRRLREHPSLALWCGGNELFNVWSGMTDQHKALRLLNAICYELDPDTPFLATSPVDGMGHGDYRFRDERGRECFQIFADARATAYTEFGCPGPSPVETLRSFLPETELWPPKPGTAWESHHAFGAWAVAPTSWLFQDLVEEYFGPCADLDELVARGQLMQAEGYKALFEEARRQKPRASMALNWCFDEPWPCAANNSLVAWPAAPKPAYHAVAASCRPVMASARIPRFAWDEGDVFAPELWMLSDAPAEVEGGVLRAFLEVGGRRQPILDWRFPALAPNRHLAGPVARLALPAHDRARSGPVFSLVLEVEGRPELGSTYRLCWKPRPAAKRAFVLPGGDNNA